MKKILSMVMLLLLPFMAVMADSQYTVTASSLNVRKYANQNSEVMFKVSKGDVVTVKEINGSWAFIDVPKGGGWVAKKYLKKVTGTAASAGSKQLKSNRTTEKITDEPVHKVMTWIINITAGYGALCFLIFLVPAIKRKKWLAHLFILGPLVFVLAIAGSSTGTFLRFFAPVAIIAVLLWPLLYARIGAGKLTVAGYVLMAGGCVALYFMFRVEFTSSFWVWFWTILSGLLSVGLLQMTIISQNYDRCPSCNYYANHPVVDSEYLDSHMSSETSTRDEYSHSETRGNVKTDYYTRYHDVTYYRHDRYRDTHRCMYCGGRFTRQRTTTNRVGKKTY